MFSRSTQSLASFSWLWNKGPEWRTTLPSFMWGPRWSQVAKHFEPICQPKITLTSHLPFTGNFWISALIDTRQDTVHAQANCFKWTGGERPRILSQVERDEVSGSSFSPQTFFFFFLQRKEAWASLRSYREGWVPQRSHLSPTLGMFMSFSNKWAEALRTASARLSSFPVW